MKHMTPELYLQCQDPNYDGDDWEKALESYVSKLNTINLPDSVKRFIDWGNLHDATVLDVTVSKEKLIIILEDNFYRLVVLIYKTVGFSTKQHNLPTNNQIWLYDEFDEEGEFYSHDILFSSGIEYNIVFKDFRFITGGKKR